MDIDIWIGFYGTHSRSKQKLSMLGVGFRSTVIQLVKMGVVNCEEKSLDSQYVAAPGWSPGLTKVLDEENNKNVRPEFLQVLG